MSTKSPKGRRLTERQAAVLAAVERLGRPVMTDLWEQFPDLAPSAIKRVLDSLEKKGLVEHAGDESQAYLNAVRWWSTALKPSQSDPRLAEIATAIAALKLEHSVDPHEQAVQVFLPLVEIESYLRGLPSEFVDGLRSAITELERDGNPVRLTINTQLTTNPEPLLVLHISPVESEG